MRLLRAMLLGAAGAMAIAGACTPFEANSGTSAAADDAGASDEPEDQGNLNTTGIGAGTGAKTGLPCDVQQLVENRCMTCHLASSTLPLLTYEDFLRTSKADPAKNEAKEALARMQDTASPMPPSPAEPPTAAEIAVFQKWIGANLPQAEACPPPAVVDAGADAAIYATPLVCTSKTTWTKSTGNTSGSHFGPGGPGGLFGGGRPGQKDDDNASDIMEPGRACITCHNANGGPVYFAAGTVYPTAHEPDDCNGMSGVDVVVTDKNNVTQTFTANAAGNFYFPSPIAAPFHVTLKRGTSERPMATAVTAGDCNTCHTQDGANGAPGRVMAP